METSKAKELAKKLKALADRGVAGEAVNAEKLLQTLMAKHGLTWDDIEKSEKHLCEYDIATKHQQLFAQLCFNVILNWNGVWHFGSSKRKIRLMLTNAEEIELTAKFDHYVRVYDEQLRLFTTAFITKHELWANQTDEFRASKQTKTKSYDDKELATIASLSMGIVRDDYKVRLEDTSKYLE